VRTASSGGFSADTISHSRRYSSFSGLGDGKPAFVLGLVDQIQRRDVAAPNALQRLGTREHSRLGEGLDPHGREAGVLELRRQCRCVRKP
jgi:hypothetical protein